MLDLERPCRARSARLPLEATLSRAPMSTNDDFIFTVPKHGLGVHADIQLDLHDATDRALVRLSAVPCSYAARFPAKLLGSNK